MAYSGISGGKGAEERQKGKERRVEKAYENVLGQEKG